VGDVLTPFGVVSGFLVLVGQFVESHGVSSRLNIAGGLGPASIFSLALDLYFTVADGQPILV
jgi:hypothetical protein